MCQFAEFMLEAGEVRLDSDVWSLKVEIVGSKRIWIAAVLYAA
jgi:hypothetical protein